MTQRVLPTGPFGEALRQGEFDAALDGECQNIVNPLLDGTKYLPHTVSSSNFGNYDDPAEIELYNRMLRDRFRTATAADARFRKNWSSIPRPTKSSCCGAIASCPTGAMLKAGK